MTARKINQIIIGWVSFSMGYQDRILPRAYGNGQPGDDEYTEERWCWDRVEAAIGKYTEPYKSFGDKHVLRASNYIREWLKDVYWNSQEVDDFVALQQLVLFRSILAAEVKANPRPKVFEVA